MGTLTAVELEDELRAGLLEREDVELRLRRFLNLAQQRLARMHDFYEMQVFSQHILLNTNNDSDRFLELPTLRECFSIVLIDGANSRKLVGRTSTFMDRIAPKPEYWARSWPTDYCLWGRWIEVYPLPLATYPIRLRWTQWPIPLTEDTDVSQFESKDELLIELAMTYAYRSLGKEEDAAKHEAFARGLLAEAKEVDRKRPDITIQPAPSDAAMIGHTGPGDPWNNPWVRSTNGQ